MTMDTKMSSGAPPPQRRSILRRGSTNSDSLSAFARGEGRQTVTQKAALNHALARQCPAGTAALRLGLRHIRASSGVVRHSCRAGTQLADRAHRHDAALYLTLE